MENLDSFFATLYQNFNDRKIDLVIANMTEHVKWANGMEGGFVYGHEGVKEYWTRQFKMISSQVKPLDIQKQDDHVVIKVHQVVHDLTGKLLADEMVDHIFYLEGDKVAEFNIHHPN